LLVLRQDAARHLRIVESLLLNWNGSTELSLTISTDEMAVIEYIQKELKGKGYITRTSGVPGSSQKMKLYFK